MLIKPEETIDKWCPLARTYAGKESPFNRNDGGGVTSHSHCVADQCMMWRWTKDSVEALGFCGLGGKPLVIP